MNPSTPSKIAGASLALLLAFAFPAISHAGPGPQYWAMQAKNASTAPTPARSAVICPGSELIPMIAMRPSAPNGRGPLTPTQVGVERVCQVCRKPVATVTKTVWPNGRGPEVTTEVSNSETFHHCDQNCPTPAA